MSVLPEGYTPLDYLQGDGQAYINTELYANSVTTKIVAEAEFEVKSGWGMVFGAYKAGKNYSLWTNSNAFTIYYYNGQKTVKFGLEKLTITADGNNWTITDVAPQEFTQSEFTTDTPIYIFSVSNGGDYPNSNMKLYSFKIYDGDTLLRDYIPCANENDELGLYDLVEGKFYGNDGSGSFKTFIAPIYVKVDGRWRPIITS